MKRSYSLDLLRLFFAYVIVLFHFDHPIPPGPTVTVQIFFVVSGYFLARKYYSRTHTDPQKQYTAWQYTLDHVRALYPHCILATVLFLGYALLRAFLVFLGAPSAAGLWEMLTLIYDQLPDTLFLQASYQYYANLNAPTWQISALVIAGYFVYALLCYDEKLSRTVLFPGAVFLTTCLLADCEDLFARMGPIFLPLLRAFGPMCMGVLTYVFSTCSLYARLKRSKLLFHGLTLLALPMMILFEDRNSLHLLWSGLLVLGCTDPDSLLDRLLGRKCFSGCAQLSLVIYLNHAVFGRLYTNILLVLLERAGIVLNDTASCVVYLVALTAACMMLKWAMERVPSSRKTRRT